MNLADAELVVLLDDLESDCAERKESFRGDTPEKVRQAACAFANDLPDHKKAGVIFIGAKDDCAPSEIAVSDELLLTLANMRCHSPAASTAVRLIIAVWPSGSRRSCGAPGKGSAGSAAGAGVGSGGRCSDMGCWIPPVGQRERHLNPKHRSGRPAVAASP